MSVPSAMSNSYENLAFLGVILNKPSYVSTPLLLYITMVRNVFYVTGVRLYMQRVTEKTRVVKGRGAIVIAKEL